MTIDFNNREVRLEYYRAWRNKNRTSIQAYKKAWACEHKHDIQKHQKTYRNTPHGKRACLISNWKKIGIIVDDYDELFERYKETKECDNCGVELFGLGRERKCCDHDHSITDKPNFRNILCCYCNLLLHLCKYFKFQFYTKGLKSAL